MSNPVKTLLTNVEAVITTSGLAGRSEITKLAIGTEGLSEEVKISAQSAIENLESIIEETIATVPGVEEISPAQRKSALYAAKLGLNPQLAVAKNRKLQPIPGIEESTIAGKVDGFELGVEDIAEPIAAIESFDGQTGANAVYYSVVYNLLAAKQDSFGELFFPTIAIDPAVEGANVQAKIINLYKDFLRTTKGDPTDNKWEKVSLVKALYDTTIIGADKNRLIPVYRPEENDDKFVTTLATVENNGDENVKTAPLRIGVAVDLLGISQTDALLAKGVMDVTDALDRRLQLEKIFFALTGKNSDDDDVTEEFGYDVKMLPYSNFTYSTQAHNKDLMLSFQSNDIYFNTSTFKTAKGNASEIMANLPANHTVRCKIVMHGDANRQTGTCAVYHNAVELVEVRNAAGELVDPDSDTYGKFKDLIKTWNAEGYKVEAYSTNSNLRKRGVLAGVDIKNQLYTVPVKTGLTILKPSTNEFDADNDATYLSTQISIAGARASLAAVETLVDFANMLRTVAVDGAISRAELMGAARFFVDTYYNEEVINLKDVVDSLKSQDRLKDIKSALENKIKDAVLRMAVESGYLVARTQLNAGVQPKLDVIIGTDPRLVQYLTYGGKIDIGSDYDVHIAFTPNPMIKNKIYITFGIFDGKRNTTPNPLNSGQMFWSPEVVYDIPRQQNGGVFRELTTMPRYLHVNNLPILTVFNVSGLTDTLDKVAVEMRNEG